MGDKFENDRAYKDGYAAQTRGARSDSNPHAEGSELHLYWQQGFKDAADGKAPEGE